MAEWIIKNKRNIFMLSLYFLVSFIDILNPTNFNIILLMIAAEMFLTFVVGFIRPYVDMKFGISLFALNAVLLFLFIKVRIYFFNIFVLSWLLWYFISALVANTRKTLYIAYMTSIISIYFFYLKGLSIPLITIAFYPLYLTGYIFKSKRNCNRSWNNIVVLLSVFAQGLILNHFLRFEESKKVIRSIITFDLQHNGIRFLMLTIAIWYVLLLIITSVLYLFIEMFNTYNRKNFIYTDSGKANDNNLVLDINLKFLSAVLLIYVAECILRKGIIIPMLSFLDVHQVVNMIFIISVYMMITALLGNNLGRLIFYSIVSILFIANFIKLNFFDEPFYPWDIYLIKTGMMIMNNYINYKIVSTLLISLILIVTAIFKLRKEVFKILRPKPNMYGLMFCTVFFGLNFLVLNNLGYLAEVDMGNAWYTGKEQTKQNGLFVENFFLIKDFKTYLADEPGEYSKEKIIDIVDSLNKNKDIETSSNLQVKPNVIVIMSESFWDATKLPGVKFDKDIIRNVKANKKGEVVSPVFGGGTANVEFEALTGFSNYFMNSGVMPYNVYLRRTTPSIATAFDKNGYDTVVIHPNDKNFYNRDKVYKYFGFNKFIDESGFDKNNDCKGSNISDEKLVDSILAQVEGNDKPKFIFGITIQNHDPYYNEYENLEVNAASEKLNTTELSILNNYASGIYDADKAFGRLIETLSKKEQPTLVYYFGDHLPRLGSPIGYYDVYNSLGYFKDKEKIDSDINCYKTPLAIWCNFKEIRLIGENISPAQLSLQILKDSGIAYPVYFDILAELRKDHPYLQNHIDSQSIQSEQIVKDYKLIQYDLLFGKQYLMEK